MSVKYKKRSNWQKVKDFLTLPLRAIAIYEDDKWGLSSLATERFEHVAAEVQGYCLDVGCGRHNKLINRFLYGNGKGIDVYPFEGLKKEQLVKDITHFPFKAATFNSVSFVGNINHIPSSMRDIELKEAYRCLKKNGNVIITMGHPITEFLVHKVVAIYDKLFGTDHDMDGIRGMHEEEAYHVSDQEIISRLEKAGFKNIVKKYFVTEWGLNHLFVGWKK